MKTLHLGNQNMATKAKILFSQKTHPRVPPMLTGGEKTKMIFFQTSEGEKLTLAHSSRGEAGGRNRNRQSRQQQKSAGVSCIELGGPD